VGDSSEKVRDPAAMTRALRASAAETRAAAQGERPEVRRNLLMLSSSLDSLAESILAAARELKRTSH
jgi:hypothetical protein